MPFPPPDLPDGLTARPLTVPDAAAVTALVAAWEDVEPSGHAYGLTDIQEEFTGPSAALDGGGIAVCAGAEVIGYGLLFVVSADPQWVAFADGAVDPRWWRRGVGGWILHRQLEQAMSLRERHAPGRAAELRATAADGRPGVLALLTAAGFRTRRWFERMTVDLAQPTPRPPDPADGVLIRPWRPADDDAVRLVSNEAFADHFGSVPRDRERWVADVSGTHAFRPGACFVAEKDGRIIGFALAAEHEADSERRGRRTGYVSRVGTVRSARGRGIASALVCRVLDALREDGYGAAELDVDSDSPTGAGRLYARLGFVPSQRDRMVIRDLVD